MLCSIRKGIPLKMKKENELVIGLLRKFRADDMLHLSRIYTSFDQPIFKNGRWNYDNPRLVVNKIKSSLEKIPDYCFDKRGLMWKREILWFWYHHAISVAINHGNLELAREFANQAVKLQGRNPCNQITRLLWHLVHGRIKQARRWFQTGVKADQETAKEILRWYDQGYFFNNRKPERRKNETKYARSVSAN